jgi:hypothetical protein
MNINLSELKSTIGLDASVSDLSRLYDRVKESVSGLSETERYALLLIAEREILGERGHTMTLKFGYLDYDLAPKCSICKGTVDKSDRSIIVISRRESSQLWITYHEECLDGREYEMEFDLLSGKATSKLGLP